MDKLIAGILVVVLGLGLAFVSALLSGWFVQVGWNGCMPHIFGLPEIGYWHGFWLSFLSTCLIPKMPTSSSS